MFFDWLLMLLVANWLNTAQDGLAQPHERCYFFVQMKAKVNVDSDAQRNKACIRSNFRII